MLLLILGLMLGLTACEQHQSQLYQKNETESILGGQPVTASSLFAQRVIYLALDVEWTETATTRAVRQKGLCTASAIAPKILLTAAHCVANQKPSTVYAVLSTNPWNHNLNLNEWLKVEKIVFHSEFKDETKIKKGGIIQNDVALIFLANSVPEERISQLATLQQTSANLDIVSIGYGVRSPLEKPTDEKKKEDDDSLLYFVMKPVVDYSPHTQTFMINQNDLTGICSGDSGGPGFIYDSNAKDFFILGVTSYFALNSEEVLKFDPTFQYNQCIGRGYYSNTLYYRDWIEKQISGL